MLNFIEYLTEARSHPELNNYKPNTMDILKQYEGQKDYFVTFLINLNGLRTERVNDKKNTLKRPNININDVYKKHKISMVKFNPTNVYNTPVGIYTYPLYYVIEKNTRVPYVGEQEFIGIIKYNRNSEKKMLEGTSYTNQDYNDDIEKIYDYMFEQMSKRHLCSDYQECINIVNELISINNTKDIPNPFTRIWYQINNLALNLILHKIQIDIKSTDPTMMWNRILFDVLGYDAVFDSGDTGTIHPNEPTQAVFLDKSAYTVIGVYDNKNHNTKEYGEEQKKIFLQNKKVKNDKINLLKSIGWKVSNDINYKIIGSGFNGDYDVSGKEYLKDGIVHNTKFYSGEYVGKSDTERNKIIVSSINCGGASNYKKIRFENADIKDTDIHIYMDDDADYNKYNTIFKNCNIHNKDVKIEHNLNAKNPKPLKNTNKYYIKNCTIDTDYCSIYFVNLKVIDTKIKSNDFNFETNIFIPCPLSSKKETEDDNILLLMRDVLLSLIKDSSSSIIANDFKLQFFVLYQSTTIEKMINLKLSKPNTSIEKIIDALGNKDTIKEYLEYLKNEFDSKLKIDSKVLSDIITRHL